MPGQLAQETEPRNSQFREFVVPGQPDLPQDRNDLLAVTTYRGAADGELVLQQRLQTST